MQDSWRALNEAKNKIDNLGGFQVAIANINLNVRKMNLEVSLILLSENIWSEKLQSSNGEIWRLMLATSTKIDWWSLIHLIKNIRGVVVGIKKKSIHNHFSFMLLLMLMNSRKEVPFSVPYFHFIYYKN